MTIRLTETDFGYTGRFDAMASPCECLIESKDIATARAVMQLVSQETARIEQKYSRYRQDNLCFQINHSNGASVPIDSETYQLLLFADSCFKSSDGLFDITSGVLRKVWHFQPGATLPTQAQIAASLPYIGWSKVTFSEHHVCLPPGFEIDFGGIGKEYAVDRCAQILLHHFPALAVLLNFGGDLRTTIAPQTRAAWHIGVDCKVPDLTRMVELRSGGVCTSGSTERYLMVDGKRYSHILNPQTGYAVSDAPLTVTVLSDQCLSSGLLATLAMLHGQDAEAFLQQQAVKYFIQW